jgi:hypothetical protein
MATLPMYQPSTKPDAWHQVSAPGGYESWSFHAHDFARDLHLTVTFWDGYTFLPTYLRRYRKYLKNPTRRLPPFPVQYPAVVGTLYRAGEAPLRFASVYPRGSLIGDVERGDVRIGGDGFEHYDDGTVQLHFEQSAFSATLTFENAIANSACKCDWMRDHAWMVTRPVCKVEGVIRAQEMADEFAGVGYQEHRFGTKPITFSARRCFSGHALFGDEFVSFQLGGDDTVHVARLCNGDVKIASVAAEMSWSGKRGMIRFPTKVQASSVLRLANPRVLDAGLYRGAVVYDAESEEKKSPAFCEVIYPRRLLGPVMSRVIERSVAWIETRQ